MPKMKLSHKLTVYVLHVSMGTLEKPFGTVWEYLKGCETSLFVECMKQVEDTSSIYYEFLAFLKLGVMLMMSSRRVITYFRKQGFFAVCCCGLIFVNLG